MMRWDETGDNNNNGGGGVHQSVENPFRPGGHAAGLMGFHSSPSQNSDGGSSYGTGFASVGTALHEQGQHQGHHSSNRFASPHHRTPGTKTGRSGSSSGGGGGGGGVGLMGRGMSTSSNSDGSGGVGVGSSTPLFGSPPVHHTSFGSSPPIHQSSTRSALLATRARDRRRFLGRLAVKATQPAALFVLVGLAFVMTATTSSWSRADAGAAAAGTADLAGDVAAELISQAAGFGSTGNGGNMIVQPSHLQSKKQAPWSGGGGHKAMGKHEIVPKPDKKRKMTATMEQQQPAEQTAQGQQLQQQQQQQQQQEEEDVPAAASTSAIASESASSAAAATPVDSPAKGDGAGVLWLKDKDGKTKVILVPKPRPKQKQEQQQQAHQQQEQKGGQKQGLLQKLGLQKKNKNKKQLKQTRKQMQQVSAETAITTAMQATDAVATDAAADPADTDAITYYYDAVPAAAMTSTGPGEEPPAAAASAGAGLITVPEVVYDKFGNSVKLVDLHDAVAATPPLAPPPHGPAPVVDAANKPSNTATRNTAARTASTSTASSSGEPQGTTNQLIIIATVATMALFGGALVARKMRTRNFLNSCIENESLEDELAYDAANTTLGAAVGYDTFSTGDIKWRGDLEKFDV